MRVEESEGDFFPASQLNSLFNSVCLITKHASFGKL